MKLKLFSVLALSGLIAAGVACGDSSSDGEGGEGGSGGDTTSTTSTKGGTTTKTTGATMNTTTGSTTSGSMACDDIGGCNGDGMDPASGCLECSIIGDDTTASDGGECVEEYVACFGTMADCSDGNADCCALDDCLAACPEPDADFWMCACGSADGASCDPAAAPVGTCFGDDPGPGLDLTYGQNGWVTCVIGVCETSCG
jgi:hypothetical protein